MDAGERIIGIDLGTTNSVVAVTEGGEPVVIFNQEGANKTPSVVAFLDGNECIVGEIARRQAATNPLRTISSIKRLMGLTWDDLEELQYQFPFEVVDHDGHLLIDVDGMGYTPEQISGLVLRKLKESAEAQLGGAVNKAVITVPAHFNDLQRTATIEAARFAGLEVLRLINEPTAAALAYGIGKSVDSEETVAVFDFGGGTFDITILEISGKAFEVLTSTGDNRLGGDDLDDALVALICDEFAQKHGVNLADDPVTLRRLKEVCEKAKCDLSTAQQAMITLPFIAYRNGQPLHLDRQLTRDEFEEIIEPFVNRTIRCCRTALEEAGLNKKDIDKVILVGGSTRIPMVQDMVEDFFGIQPFKGINPDEVVALGAAAQAGIFTGNIEEVVLIDVVPHSLGIEVKDGKFSRIIEKNEKVPYKAAKNFTTTEDNQTFVVIHVLQGESGDAAQNRSLGKFMLTDIPPQPRGRPRIRVTFFMNADGVMEISAEDLGSGVAKTLTIVHAELDEKEKNARKRVRARRTKEPRRAGGAGERATKRYSPKGGTELRGGPGASPRRQAEDESGARRMVGGAGQIADDLQEHQDFAVLGDTNPGLTPTRPVHRASSDAVPLGAAPAQVTPLPISGRGKAPAAPAPAAPAPAAPARPAAPPAIGRAPQPAAPPAAQAPARPAPTAPSPARTAPPSPPAQAPAAKPQSPGLPTSLPPRYGRTSGEVPTYPSNITEAPTSLGIPMRPAGEFEEPETDSANSYLSGEHISEPTMKMTFKDEVSTDLGLLEHEPTMLMPDGELTESLTDSTSFDDVALPAEVESALIAVASGSRPASPAPLERALGLLDAPPWRGNNAFPVAFARARLLLGLGRTEPLAALLTQLATEAGENRGKILLPVVDQAVERLGAPEVFRRARALVRFKAGDLEGACEDFEVAAKADPAEGDRERLEEMYKARIARGPDPAAQFKLVRLYLKVNRVDEATELLQDLVHNDAYETRALKILGLCHWQKNLHFLAWQKFKQLRQTDEIREILYRLGTDMESTGQLQNAVQVYEHVLKESPDYRDVSQKLKKLRYRIKIQEEEQSSSVAAVLSDPRFTIIEEINRGSMGIIYKAKDKTLDEIVALKVLNDYLCTDPSAVERFKREARAAKKLAHPYIVRIHDMFESGSKRFISMEYIEGTDLKRMLADHVRFEEDTLVYYFLQICDALSYAHKLNIIHRDIKPANVMITLENQVKVTDFGIAKILKGEDSTKSGTAVIGTPLYMAPEQITGEGVDARSDIYSLGIMMYELTSGQPPFYLGNIEYHHIHTPPPPLPESISPRLRRIIMKCVEKNRENRYQSIDQLYQDLRAGG